MHHRRGIWLLFLWLSLPVFGGNPAARDGAESAKLIGYFSVAAETYRLRLVGEQFFVQQWPIEGSLNEWSAVAAGADGEIDQVTVLDGDDIEVQLSSPNGVQVWEVNLDVRGSAIRPHLIWAGTLGPSDAGWAVYHVQDDVHVATNGSAIVAIERGVVRTVDPRVHSTDGASRKAHYAAATGHGLSVWRVAEGQLRFDSARDYNLNVAHVAAIDDGGWLMLTTRKGVVQLVAVDSSLLPRWLLPLPGGIAWELYQVGDGVVVAASGELNAWLVTRSKCHRFEWSKTSATAEVIPSDGGNFVRLTDGMTVGEPYAKGPVATQSVTGIGIGSKWLIVSPAQRQAATVSIVAILLLVAGTVTVWAARRTRGKRFGSSKP